MSSDILVNGLGLTYKGTVGISSATMPDVCKTPSPGGPVPVPYPNIADQSSLTDGTTTVKAHGEMIAVKGSHYGRSNGDEAGTAGGVKSNVNMKATDWITYSFDVQLDGQNACRHTDKKFHNNQNTVDLAGNVDPVKPAGLSPADSKLWDECSEQHDKYKDLQSKEAQHKNSDYRRLTQDFYNGRAGPAAVRELWGICHEKSVILEDLIEERIKYVQKGCDKFDWFNQGTTESERRSKHDSEITHVRQQLNRLRELGRRLE
jgi:Toxin PAAR-like domain